MWIVKLETNPNGSHNDHRADHITTVPEGWAMIPDDFQLPASYPFGEITAEEVTYTREVEVEKEVTKTREIETVDEDGNPITITEEYKEMERVTEERPYTMMTVISMTEGVVPPAPEPEPTWNETMESRVDDLQGTTAALEEALCEMDIANEVRLATIEEALCEIDMG